MMRVDDLIRAVREAATIGEVVAAFRVDEPPLLTSYTEADLAEREAAAKAADEAERQAKAEAEQRAQADRDRDGFALTGSDRAADVAAAAGQACPALCLERFDQAPDCPMGCEGLQQRTCPVRGFQSQGAAPEGH